MTYHKDIDGIIDDGILDNLDKIKQYPVRIDTEELLAKEIASIAIQAMILGYKFEDEKRLLTEVDAYQQVSQSASFFKAILEFVAGGNQGGKVKPPVSVCSISVL